MLENEAVYILQITLPAPQQKKRTKIKIPHSVKVMIATFFVGLCWGLTPYMFILADKWRASSPAIGAEAFFPFLPFIIYTIIYTGKDMLEILKFQRTLKIKNEQKK
jgi:hypothetical protein